MGRKKFWDTEQQKKNAHEWMKRQGLKTKDEKNKNLAREFYRKKDQFKQKNKQSDFKKSKKKLSRNKPTSDEKKKSRLAKDFGFSPKIKNNNVDILPGPTKRKWKGEHFNSKKNKWQLKKNHWYNPKNRKWIPGKMPKTLRFFYWYIEFILNDINYPDPQPLGECHKEWSIRIQHGRRVLMLCPRDHFKTSLLNVGYILFHICEKWKIAKKGIWNISWDKALAIETFDAIVQNLEENPKIMDFYGYLIDDTRSKTMEALHFSFQHAGSRPGLKCLQIKSGKITGGHPGIVFCDDIEDEDLTPVFMRKLKKVFKKKLIPAMGKFGRIIITGTIKGWNKKNDIYLWLENNPTWTVYKYPAANKMPKMKNVFYEKRLRPILEFGKPIIINGKTIMEEYFYVELNEDPTPYITLYPERYSIIDLIIKRLEMQEDGKGDDEFWSEFFLIASNPLGKFFKKDRIKVEIPPGFNSWEQFKEHLWEFHYPIYLWIDPGGGGSEGHGMAIVVGCKMLGKYYLLDFLVVRAGLHQVARSIARLLVKWKVSMWGGEGNFGQKETLETLDVELYRYMMENAWTGDYSYPEIKNNTGDKGLRIQTNVSNMIGLEGTDYILYVNDSGQDYEQFNEEVGAFGLERKPKKHEFDLLDCSASMKIHMFSQSIAPVGV